MDKIGRNKRKWLEKQGCVFLARFETNLANVRKRRSRNDEVERCAYSTLIYTQYGEYIGLADLGEKAQTVNFIYKHRLTQLSSINRAKNLPLSTTGCNAVSIGFNEKEQAWYGWTHRGYGKFYVGYEIKPGSIMDTGKYKKVETLDQAKELAIFIADYLN